MASLIKREPTDVETHDVFDSFDRMFEDWWRPGPFRRLPLARDWMTEAIIRVDEFEEEGTLVVRAELPGVDPEKDIELTVTDSVLHIDAQRREEEKTEKRGYVRQEMRRGHFHRALRLPAGASESDVKAW